MVECTVYSPCGRYVVRLTSNTQHQRLWLTVTPNTQQPPVAQVPPFPLQQTTTSTPGIVWSHAKRAAPPPPHLVASLGEADIVTLTNSAGVRKTFATFATMLYDALIGRSACVHFFVETVAEMRERIQRDVQGQQGPSSSVSSASVRQAESRRGGSNSSSGSGGKGRGSEADTQQCRPRVCTAVGDTVIELDDDIAAEVLEQRFLTVDYDVDFTRAIFPIPLTEPTETMLREAVAEPAAPVAAVAPASPPAVASPLPAPVPAASEKEEERETSSLRCELQQAFEHLAVLEAENGKLRKENAALVQLSKQKMHEMQRLCDDFQYRVHGAAEAEQLRAKNAALRVELQDALEDRRAALQALEAERAQRRLQGGTPTTPRGLREPAARRSISARGSSGGGRRSTSGSRENPYLRSLSRDSTGGGARGRTTHYRDSMGGTGGDDGGGGAARFDRHGQPLLSPTPTPAAKRRIGTTRFDTPPATAARRTGPSPRRGSTSRRTATRAASTHSTNSHDGGGGGGGGDSPAPRDRTGGRQADVVKPRRSSSSGGGGGDRYPQQRHSGSRSSSAPRRGPSLWADTSDHPSSHGSAASSRCSSQSHERLYRASTASSRLHQTPKAYALEQLGARRAVFH